jgi:hypothetical protein
MTVRRLTAGPLQLLSVVVAVLISVATCAPSNDVALRTNPNVQRNNLCFGQAIPNVEGVLRGSWDASPDYVWLEQASGRRLFALWPAGWRVSFKDQLTLFDELGVAVATEGMHLEFPTVSLGSHTGTSADPYPLTGTFPNGCYWIKPESDPRSPDS